MEQSATPWRVFDAPPGGNGDDGAGAQPAPAQGAGSSSAAAAPTTKLAIAGVIGAVLIGLVAVVVVVSGSGGQVIEAPDRAIPGNGDTAMLAGAADIVVDVTGAVTKPGVDHLPAGSRVGDAIDAAGGFSPRVDADRVATALNLAAAVTDGSQVHVPSRDDPSASASGGGPAGGTGGGSASGGVNLNSATQAELEALPGIGPVTAAKIIESRTATPFKSVDDLRERKLVGEKAFEQLKSLVTVG